MTMHRRVLLSAAAAAALAGRASAQTGPEIKLGHVGEPDSLFDQSAREFARRANERLGAKARVTPYGSSQLGSDVELLRKLKLGTVDLALPSTVMSSQVPLFGLFEMPYLVRDRAHMARIRDAIVTPAMAPAAERDGFRILAVWENGVRHITNSKRPIRVPADLQGIKLRVPAGEWRVKMFQAYGASPSPLAFSEVFVALQTGVMDGQENPLSQIYPARFQEVQRYLSMTGHVYTPAYLTAGRSWNRLGAEVQQTLAAVAQEMQPVALETAARLDTELLEKLKAAGMAVNEVDKDAFIKASDAVYKQFASQVPEGGALVQKAIELGRAS